MDRTQLIAALGLAAAATDTEIVTAITALKAQAADQATALTALTRTLGVADTGALTPAVEALKARAEQARTAPPDAAAFVPRAVFDEVNTQLAALKAGTHRAELDSLIEQGLADGRIAGQATANWLRAQGVVALKAHLADTPAVAALTRTQTGGQAPAGATTDPNALDEADLAVCQATGLSPEQYRQAR